MTLIGPFCRRCLAAELRRVAALLPPGDRYVALYAAKDVEDHAGCVHLAVDSSEPDLRGIFAWTRCGKRSDSRSACKDPSHVNCLTCRSRARLDG